MGLRKNAWQYFKPNQSMLLMGGFFCVIAIVVVVTMHRQRQQQPFAAKLRYENLTPEQKRQFDNFGDAARLGEDDGNVRYAERLREASSVGLGLSLYLVRELVAHNRTLSLSEVMNEFAHSDILPPFCQVVSPSPSKDFGVVQTPNGLYIIRYSPVPLKVEVISSGAKGLADGPTFLLRVPDTSAAHLPLPAQNRRVTSAGAWATLFEAPLNENHAVPSAFAPTQTFTALNWRVQPLQQTELAPDKVQELNRFLQQQTP